MVKININKKGKRDPLLIGIIGLVAFIFLVFVVMAMTNIVPAGDGIQKYKVECSGEIHNPWGFDSEFSKVNCVTKEGKLFSYSIKPLFFGIGDEGTLVLQVDNIKSTKTWDCDEGKFCEFDISIKGVEAGSKGELKLLNKEGEVWDRRDMTV